MTARARSLVRLRRTVAGPRVVAAVAAVLPGALAGAHVAGLIFFLNPSIPFGAGPVARGVAAYGLLGGLAGLALLGPFFLPRPRRAARALPWALTAVLAGSALLYWTHASRFAYFLPPGINVRLIKAAALFSLAVLIAFYTALLHTLHRRRYGPRTRLGYTLLVVASLYAMVERREAFRPGPGPTPRPSAVEAGQRPHLVVVGLDGATLDAVLPLAGRGMLPFFARMEDEGAYGRLESLSPNRPAALWTTLATGKFPYKHGIVDEETYPARFLGPGTRLEILPAGVGFRLWGIYGGDVRRTDARDRRALALWEALPRLGVASGVVGWPAASPVPPEPSFGIAARFFTEGDETAARPAEIAVRARLFRVRAAEIDPVVTARFGDAATPEVMTALAGDLWRQSLSFFLLDQNRDLPAAFIELDGLSAVSRRYFGGYAAEELDGLPGPDNRRAAQVLGAYYAHLDAFLELLWQRTPSPKILAVVSAYGTAPPRGWRRLWRELERESAVEGTFVGSPDGVLMLLGDGVRAGELLTGAQLVDVAPTLLYGLGVPVARDLDGRVLTTAFDRAFLARHPLTFLPSYETLTEGDGR